MFRIGITTPAGVKRLSIIEWFHLGLIIIFRRSIVYLPFIWLHIAKGDGMFSCMGRLDGLHKRFSHQPSEHLLRTGSHH